MQQQWGGSPDDENKGPRITNRIALFLALAIVAAFLVDYILFDLNGGLFLARKLIQFIEYLKFWR